MYLVNRPCRAAGTIPLSPQQKAIYSRWERAHEGRGSAPEIGFVRCVLFDGPSVTKSAILESLRGVLREHPLTRAHLCREGISVPSCHHEVGPGYAVGPDGMRHPTLAWDLEQSERGVECAFTLSNLLYDPISIGLLLKGILRGLAGVSPAVDDCACNLGYLDVHIRPQARVDVERLEQHAEVLRRCGSSLAPFPINPSVPLDQYVDGVTVSSLTDGGDQMECIRTSARKSGVQLGAVLIAGMSSWVAEKSAGAPAAFYILSANRVSVGELSAVDKFGGSSFVNVSGLDSTPHRCLDFARDILAWSIRKGVQTNLRLASHGPYAGKRPGLPSLSMDCGVPHGATALRMGEWSVTETSGSRAMYPGRGRIAVGVDALDGLVAMSEMGRFAESDLQNMLGGCMAACRELLVGKR